MPCEILVMAIDKPPAPGNDPNSWMCWKRGMPVAVQPEGFRWGRLEEPTTGDGTFYIITLSNVTYAVAKAVFDAMDNEGYDEDGNPINERLRMWRLMIDTMPAAWKTQLATTGRLTKTKNQLKPYVKHQRLGTGWS